MGGGAAQIANRDLPCGRLCFVGVNDGPPALKVRTVPAQALAMSESPPAQQEEVDVPVQLRPELVTRCADILIAKEQEVAAVSNRKEVGGHGV
jgi:hypothetical protein